MTPKRTVDAMAWLRLFRHRMVNLLLGIVVALSTVGLLYLYVPHFVHGGRVTMRFFVYIAAYLALAMLFLMRRLPIVWRALGFLALLYGFSVYSFAGGWLGSSARTYLLVLIVLSGVLIGPRSGVFAAILSLATYVVFGLAYAQGWLVYDLAPAHASSSIITVEGIGFCLSVGMIGVALWFIDVGLTASAQATEDARQSRKLLAERAQELDDANHQLAEHGAQLEAANEELEAFAYSVSHDLRAPLRHIDGFVHLLAQREVERLDTTSQHYLESIVQATGKMSRLIDDLLTFSRSSRADMQWHRVELDELIPSVQKEVLAEVRNRTIDCKIAPLPAVAGDHSLLRQVWANLLANAVKYTAPREQAHIEVGVLEQEGDDTGEVTVYIRDNGVGFDSQYGHKLFGVFQRLHRADEFEGTGIGLAIVRRIVSRHGGRVWAEGRPDQGATFYLTLKAADEEIEPEAQ